MPEKLSILYGVVKKKTSIVVIKIGKQLSNYKPHHVQASLTKHMIATFQGNQNTVQKEKTEKDTITVKNSLEFDIDIY